MYFYSFKDVVMATRFFQSKDISELMDACDTDRDDQFDAQKEPGSDTGEGGNWHCGDRSTRGLNA